MRGTEIKMLENGSKKELHTYKELKKSIIKPSISSKAITYRETPSSDNRQLFDLKKNIFEKKSKIHCRKASKGGIDISNYEKRNTPNNQYYEIVKPELMAELYHNVNDVNKTDIANYSSTQPMEVSKKYFTKKASNIEDECVSSKKKKCKVSSRNSYATSSKPSISQRKSSVSSSRKKCASKNQNFYKVDSNSHINGKQIHTARVNLSQMNHSPSRINANLQSDKISTKYGYFGGDRNDQHFIKLNSQRNTASNSKIISCGSIIHSSSLK